MYYEVEFKARLNQPEKIEEQVSKIGKFFKETFKEDVYFRRAGNSDIFPDDLYRLRREGDKAIVTFKQLVIVDEVEVNQETEFTVDDAHGFYRFAHRFGFEPFVVKRKKSRVYRVGQVNVELNEVEHLGDFAEIEILCDNEANVPAASIAIGQVLLRLGLTRYDIESRRYIELIQEAYPVRYQFVDDSSIDWPFIEIK
jgi:adenylate cyclase class 2